MEFTLLAAAGIGVAAGHASLVAIHRGDPDLGRRSFDLAVMGIIVGIAAGRLWAMVASGTNPLTHVTDILIVRGGVDPFAATAAALATVSWSARHTLWPSLDALAPAAAFGLAGWHAGCLVRGACLGTTTGLPWGIATTPGSALRHPVEIYAAVLLIAAGFGLVWLWRHHPATGATTWAALFAVAATRTLTEPMRPVLGRGRTMEYGVTAAAVVVLGVIVWWQRRANSRQPTTDGKNSAV